MADTDTPKKTITLYNECTECGGTDCSCDNGQWFCMGCGMEVPAPTEVDADKEVKVWARIGFTIPLTLAELHALDGGEGYEEVVAKIRREIKDGTAYPDGDCYIPEEGFSRDDGIPAALKTEYNFDL